MFENEHTLRKFLTEKGEGEFHDRYEQALERSRAEFGSRLSMFIGGKEVRSSKALPHFSPIDRRLLLAHVPVGTVKNVRDAISSAKKAFAAWAGTDFRDRV